MPRPVSVKSLETGKYDSRNLKPDTESLRHKKRRRLNDPQEEGSSSTLLNTETIAAIPGASDPRVPDADSESNLQTLDQDAPSVDSYDPPQSLIRPLPPSRPETPIPKHREPDPDIFISPHTSRWLEDQQFQSTFDLGLNAWENIQSVGRPGEAEEHAQRMIDEVEPQEDTPLELQAEGLSHDMQILLGNGNFQVRETDVDAAITASPEHHDPTTISAPARPVSDILHSRLRNTHTASSSASSEASIDSFTLEPLDQLDDSDGNIIGVPHHRSSREISDFVLGLAIWCEVKGITRLDYESLRQVLTLGGDAVSEELPTRLSTLQQWARNRLPLPPLQKTKVPIKTEQMPSKTSGVTAALYYIDPRYLVAMLLSARKQESQLFFGMAEIVDSPVELWQSNCWGSSIRTCSSDFARYSQDQKPIIPSDFVQYGGLNFARVVFFGRDKRPSSINRDAVLLLAQVVAVQCTLDGSDSRSMVLVEDQQVELLPEDVSYVDYMAVKRTFEPNDVGISAPVTLVYNSQRQEFRSTDKLTAIKGELELQYYGREQITRTLESGVTSLPFTCFIDDFGLYRNMYRSLTGIYLTTAALTLQERQRTRNVYPITLGPHGSSLNDVVKALEKGFKLLEHGCRLQINTETKMVWAPILAFTGDMKSQQEAAGFLGPRANLSCRMCLAGPRTRDDMVFDTCENGRYHHATLFERARGAKMGISLRIKHFSSLGLAMEPSALQAMTPALDLIVSRPGDPAHSEFAGIVRRVMTALCKLILTPKALDEFAVQFRGFPFPPGWGRIQSPHTHMGCWTMSECARASVIIPVLLRRWPLRMSHLRAEYKAALMTQSLCTEDLIASEWIIVFLGQIAKSNSLVASTSLSVQDRATLSTTVLQARLGFQALMNATVTVTRKQAEKAKLAKEAKAKKAKKTTGRSNAQTVVSDSDQSAASQTSQVSRQSLGTAINSTLPGATDEDKMAALPNVHTALHFSALMAEYGLLWNVNALPGERMHKFFKGMVLATNHRKVERQLLIKSCIQMTIRLALQGAFDVVDPAISSALQSLQRRCPKLFQDLVPSGMPVTAEEDNEEAQQFIGGNKHVNPLAHGKISSHVVSSWDLPTKMSQVDLAGDFYRELQAALIEYGHNTYTLGSKPLYWYNQFSFQDPSLSARTSLKRGDFIRMCGDRFTDKPYAQVLQVFSHCFARDTERRIFVRIKRLRFVAGGQQDRLLRLPLLEYTEEKRTISILEVSSRRVWIAPTRQEGAGSNGERMLLCNWDVQFS